MGIGGAGLVKEIFFSETWNVARVGVFVGMILGSGAINVLWLSRYSPTGGPSPLPPSSSSSVSESQPP